MNQKTLLLGPPPQALKKEPSALMPILMALVGCLTLMNLGLLIFSSKSEAPVSRQGNIQADIAALNQQLQTLRKDLEQLRQGVQRDSAILRRLDNSIGSLNTAIVQLTPPLSPDAQSHAITPE